MAQARVTTIGAYVEVDPQEAARLSAIGAYIELRQPGKIRLTTVGAYVELVFVPTSGGIKPGVEIGPRRAAAIMRQNSG